MQDHSFWEWLSQFPQSSSTNLLIRQNPVALELATTTLAKEACKGALGNSKVKLETATARKVLLQDKGVSSFAFTQLEKERLPDDKVLPDDVRVGIDHCQVNVERRQVFLCDSVGVDWRIANVRETIGSLAYDYLSAEMRRLDLHPLVGRDSGGI